MDNKISPENLLICSTVGEVYAIKKTDGARVWTAKLSGVGYGVGALFVSDSKAYVGMNGHLVALNLTDGAEVWRNPLSGMRYSEVSVLVANTSSSKGSIVLVASFGKLCGIGAELGETLWKNELKGGCYYLPCLMLDSTNPDVVMVGCGKRLYKINLFDGQTIWNQTLSSNLLGPPYVTMATHQSSLQAAFTYTGFNNNPVAQQVAKEKNSQNNGS
ncbi:16528_t:CDS:1 [Funneliformis geosporum]|uniref:6004_t:CDS:1 n=1 Tax=Funneliformis geosporum TaxID=1117311 RepID=A0A9W4X1R5_9GLOM|nr:16528_t:CDS:1 [Funneliformis geosporum]CAI2180060.1 6004_t:CDS:1 [Funneliformis geosporum]